MRRLVAATAIAGLLVSAASGVARGDTTGTAGTAARQPHRTAAAKRLSAPRSPLTYEASPRGNRATEIVQWHNPGSSSLRKVVVRYARGTKAPTGPHRGHGVSLTSRRAHTAKLTRLGRDTTYSVSIFALDRSGRASKPAVARFTTPAEPAAGRRGVVRGAVADTAGRPLARAVVEAYDFDSGRSASTVTNAAGAYVLGLPVGSWGLFASGANATGGNSDATGYSYDEATVTVAGSVTHSFRLPAGGRLSGRIVDPAGLPIADAKPYVISPLPYVTSGFAIFGLSLDGYEPRTDADGPFVFRGVPAGEAGVVCATGVAARVAGRLTDFLSTCGKRSTAVAAGRSLSLAQLTMTAGSGAAVTGRLRGTGGRALVGAITLTSTKDDYSEAYGYTDPQGNYRIPGVASGTYRVCGTAASGSGSRTGWAPGCARATLHVRGSSAAHPALRLQRGAAVSGTVTGPGGRRLTGATVSVTDNDDDGGYARTDSRGQYRVVGLPKGEYRACVEGSAVTVPAYGAGQGCWRHRSKIAVRAKRVRSGIDVRLPAAGGLAGTVSTGAGAPAAFASVLVRPAVSDGDGNDDGDDDGEDDFDSYGYVMTDARGRYTVAGLPTGRYLVCVASADDFDSPENDVTPSCTAPVAVRAGRVTRVADVVLAAPTAIRVQVRDSSGLPVSGVNAAALSHCRSDCERTSLVPGVGVDVDASTLTDADGQATLPLSGAGDYSVCLFAIFGTTVSGGSPTGYADGCHGRGFDVRVVARATTTVTMTLATGGSVSGRLTDAAGRGVADGRVVVPGAAADDVPGYGDDGKRIDFGSGSFSPDFPDPFAGSRTGTDGRFTVIGVRPGTWTVCAHDARANGYDDEDDARFAESCSGGPTSPGVTVTAGNDTRADIVAVKPH